MPGEHDLIQHSPTFMSVFFLEFGKFIGYLAAFLTGLVPYLKYRDKKRQQIEDQKQAALIEEEKKKIAFVTQPDFKKFDEDNTKQHRELKDTFQNQHDDLGRIVKSAAIESSNASMAVQSVAAEIRQDQLLHNEKIRETLEVFKMGIDQSLGQVHEKANQANIEVAKLEGRVAAIENDRRTA